MTPERFGIIAPHPPIIVREVGGTRTDVTSATVGSLRAAAGMLGCFDPDTVVIMSPHAPTDDAGFAVDSGSRISGSLHAFGAPQVRLQYETDTALATALMGALERAGLPAVDRAAAPRLESGTLDHGGVVPLSFLLPPMTRPVVVLSLSHQPYEAHAELGRLLASVAASLGRRVAFVASGDCSHRLTHDGPYPYSPRAAELDSAIVAGVADADFGALSRIDRVTVVEGGECGLRSFITLGGFLGDGCETRVLSYEGPWGVGYLTAVAGSPGLLATLEATPGTGCSGGEPEHPLPALAREAIEQYVRNGVVIDCEAFDDPGLPSTAGVFVSLHVRGELRGCIGTISAHRGSLAEEVVHNALEAATRDPRFPPLTASELADLDVKVDVLGDAESCAFSDLDPAVWGVIVTSGWRRGLLLPDIEGVDTAEKQVGIALRKAGIDPGEDYTLERFGVDRHG